MRQKWTHWYLLVLLGVFPLWLGFYGYRDLTAQKFGFFVAVTGLWLAGLAWFGVRERAWHFPKHAGSVCALLLMAGLCLSAVCSRFGARTIIGVSRYDGLLTWVLYIAVFLGVSAYGRPRPAYAYALAFSGTVNCVVAVIQLLGYNCLWLYPGAWTFYDSGVKYTGEFLGLIGNTDLLGAFFCLVIPVCFGSFVVFGGRKTACLLPSGALCLFVLLKSGVSGALVGLLVCVLVGAPLIVTGRERLSRGVYVLSLLCVTAGISAAVRFSEAGTEMVLCKLMAALFLAGLVFAAFARLLGKWDKKLCKLPRTIAAIEILCVVLTLGAVYLAPPPDGTLYELSRLLHGEVSASFGSHRVEIWQETWRLIKERPILGGGPGTLEARTALEFSRFSEEAGRLLRVHVDNAHNEYLNLLVNDGAVSLLPYLALMLATARRVWRDRNDRALCAWTLPLLAWWGEACFGLGLCVILPMMWAVWGLVWATKVNDNNIM